MRSEEWERFSSSPTPGNFLLDCRVQARHIVKPGGAGVEGRLCDFNTKCVDRQRNVNRVAQGGNDRRDAVDLLVNWQIGVAGAGGIAAYIQDVGAWRRRTASPAPALPLPGLARWPVRHRKTSPA